MEAGNPKRAALRLAALGGGVFVTAALVLLTGILLVNGQEESPQIAEAKPDWDEIETGESYRLPLVAIQPATMVPVVQPAPYEPPPYQRTTLSHAPDVVQEIVYPIVESTAEPDRSRRMAVHNSAVFGPPEDNSLPPIPTPVAGPEAEALTPQLASRTPPRPTTSARAPAGPPTAWEETLPIDPPTNADAFESLSESIHEPALEKSLASSPEPVEKQLDQASLDELLSYTTSTNDLSKRLSSEVQDGFQLGKSGAVYAARAKFIAVLRQIALARDAEAGGSEHTSALAEGLRTLDDADDFVPRGDALEAELDVAAIARSHGLDLLDDQNDVAPHEAIARYSQHAAKRLAEAAADEPAGSMALYGLGKTYTRLEAQAGDTTAGRKSLVMYRAAVDTHPENYLAANELGVRLARDGRYEQASRVLREAASQPAAIASVHANLAAIEQRLGHAQEATTAKLRSEQLTQQERAAGEISRRHGVQWVNPETFQHVGGGTTPTAQVPTDPHPATQPQQHPIGPPPAYAATEPNPKPAEAGGWNGFVRSAKRVVGWSEAQPAPASQPSYAQPPLAMPQGRVVR